MDITYNTGQKLLLMEHSSLTLFSVAKTKKKLQPSVLDTPRKGWNKLRDCNNIKTCLNTKQTHELHKNKMAADMKTQPQAGTMKHHISVRPTIVTGQYPVRKHAGWDE